MFQMQLFHLCSNSLAALTALGEMSDSLKQMEIEARHALRLVCHTFENLRSSQKLLQWLLATVCGERVINLEFSVLIWKEDRSIDEFCAQRGCEREMRKVVPKKRNIWDCAKSASYS